MPFIYTLTQTHQPGKLKRRQPNKNTCLQYIMFTKRNNQIMVINS